MGRHPRTASSTGYYHVVTRGNRRQAIFQQDTDYAAYCGLGTVALRAQAVQLNHFCLMPNPTHLLVHSPELSVLSRAMHQLQRRDWFHVRRTYQLTGHLWQGRYRR